MLVWLVIYGVLAVRSKRALARLARATLHNRLVCSHYRTVNPASRPSKPASRADVQAGVLRVLALEAIARQAGNKARKQAGVKPAVSSYTSVARAMRHVLPSELNAHADKG